MGADRSTRRASDGNDIQALAELARLAQNQPADRSGLVRLADNMKAALGSEQVFFVYVEEDDWIICGDSGSGDDVGTGRIGLWIVNQQAQTLGVPVAFKIESRRVDGFAPALEAKGQPYIAMRLPIGEGAAEMVIIRGRWQQSVDFASLGFLEAARPALLVFLERMLDSGRAAREREQEAALANAAEVLTQAEDPLAVLANMAAAMSNFTGFELVTIALWDGETKGISQRVMGVPRAKDTSLVDTWLKDTRFDHMFVESVRQREAFYSEDAQNDPRNPPEVLDFVRWILTVSGAIVPVYFQDEPLAAISFASFRQHTFPPEERDFLNGMAAKLAVGLKAMKMYKALTASRKQLEEYTQQLEANRQIEHRLARTDALTGIPNRRYVEEVIEAEHARATRHGGSLSVGMLDVDKFKGINDIYGHDAGDEVLVQLARMARQSCRKGDVVGRYGGDEFLFVLPEANLEATLEFGDRFRSQVAERPFRLPGGETLSLKISLGVADAGRRATTAEMIAGADAALYQAKSAGGDRVCADKASAA
jgi:diguanylate cyclase (GGDEF)-like protein